MDLDLGQLASRPYPSTSQLHIRGGSGFQCAAFRLAVKDYYQGRVILQHLQQTLDRAPPHDGVEKMKQNFFEEQTDQRFAL
jgi:hypothetical protein